MAFGAVGQVGGAAPYAKTLPPSLSDNYSIKKYSGWKSFCSILPTHIWLISHFSGILTVWKVPLSLIMKPKPTHPEKWGIQLLIGNIYQALSGCSLWITLWPTLRKLMFFIAAKNANDNPKHKRAEFLHGRIKFCRAEIKCQHGFNSRRTHLFFRADCAGLPTQCSKLITLFCW